MYYYLIDKKYMEKQAIFWLGCFWWVQSYFDKIEWVLETEVGYAWWEQENATYEDIWDHSEVIKIIYDEDQITFSDLITLFIDKKDHHERPINVRVESVWDYYKAEEYHQKFHAKQENTWILL